MRLSIFALLALAACSSKSDPASPTTPVVPAPEPAPPAPAAKRTIEVRNPFGNTDVAENLMADGDFELTGRYDQQPWLAFGSSGQSILNFETGGRCKSGVRCLVLKPGETVIGWMATPREGQVTVSLWARPQGGSCEDLQVYVLDIDDDSSTSAIKPPKVDESGVCLFSGLAPTFPGGAPAVYLEVKEKAKVTSVTVDDVVALPATGGQSFRGLSWDKAAAPARAKFISEWVRRHRRFGLPPAVGVERPAKRPADRLRER